MVTIFAVEAYLLPIVGVAAALVAVLATLLIVRLLTSNAEKNAITKSRNLVTEAEDKSKKMLDDSKEKAKKTLEESEEKAKSFFKSMYELRDDNFGNGRDVRNFFENVIAAHSDRVSEMTSPTKDDLMNILPEDLEKAETMEN